MTSPTTTCSSTPSTGIVLDVLSRIGGDPQARYAFFKELLAVLMSACRFSRRSPTVQRRDVAVKTRQTRTQDAAMRE